MYNSEQFEISKKAIKRHCNIKVKSTWHDEDFKCYHSDLHVNDLIEFNNRDSRKRYKIVQS